MSKLKQILFKAMDST